MEKMTYNDRVNQCAYDLTQEVNIDHYDMDDTIQTLLPAARIAVAKMAEAVRQAFYFFSCDESNMSEDDKFGLECCLIEYGLITDKPAEPTTENNWKL